MDRRTFVKAGIAAVGGGALVPRTVLAAPEPGVSVYGPLATEPDEHGLLLPEGFTARIVAVAGDPVADTAHTWHLFPDGAGTFPDGEGGWYYVCNSEVFDHMATDGGGASAIHFGPDGEVLDAYPVLRGSNSNCAGGPTPWGTWLSCEENSAEQGRVWECDPTGVKAAVAHEAMGLWAHEAAAVDPVGEQVYLTQDHPEGLLYRFTPDAYPDLSAGSLEACIVAADGTVTWAAVADPSGATAPTRTQVPGATVFPGGEGIWYFDGWIYFTSKYTHSVHGIDLAAQTYRLIWKGDPDGLGVEGAVLSHVDNITVDEGSGDLVVAEDGGNMELVVIAPDGSVGPLVRVVGAGHETSEMTGPVFNPTRDRLYFSSQRGPGTRTRAEIVPGITAEPDSTAVGVTYEITGPFRGRRETPTTTTTAAPTTTAPAPSTTAAPVDTLATVAPETTATAGSGGSDGSSVVPLVVGGAAVAAAVGGVVVGRQRRTGGEPPAPTA
jgi:secreted PhoX family phosphatase